MIARATHEAAWIRDWSTSDMLVGKLSSGRVLVNFIITNDDRFTIHSNRILDPWRTPYEIETLDTVTNVIVSIRSFGPDRLSDTSDDIVYKYRVLKLIK